MIGCWVRRSRRVLLEFGWLTQRVALARLIETRRVIGAASRLIGEIVTCWAPTMRPKSQILSRVTPKACTTLRPHCFQKRSASHCSSTAFLSRTAHFAHLDRKSTRLNSSHLVISY